jgi:hypothetical protein
MADHDLQISCCFGIIIISASKSIVFLFLQLLFLLLSLFLLLGRLGKIVHNKIKYERRSSTQIWCCVQHHSILRKKDQPYQHVRMLMTWTSCDVYRLYRARHSMLKYVG